MTERYGPKMMDGLRAYVEQATHRDEPTSPDHPAGYWFADSILVRQGYSEKVAASIIDRLASADLIEWGVTKRTGWLTDRGADAVSGRPVKAIAAYDDDLDEHPIDLAIAAASR